MHMTKPGQVVIPTEGQVIFDSFHWDGTKEASLPPQLQALEWAVQRLAETYRSLGVRITVEYGGPEHMPPGVTSQFPDLPRRKFQTSA